MSDVSFALVCIVGVMGFGALLLAVAILLAAGRADRRTERQVDRLVSFKGGRWVEPGARRELSRWN